MTNNTDDRWCSTELPKELDAVLTLEGRRVAKGFMLKHFGKNAK